MLKIFDREYRIKEHLGIFPETGSSRPTRPAASLSVVRDSAQIEEMEQKQREALGDIANGMRHFYGFDTSAGEEEQKAFYQTMTALVESRGLSAPATLGEPGGGPDQFYGNVRRIFSSSAFSWERCLSWRRF